MRLPLFPNSEERSLKKRLKQELGIRSSDIGLFQEALRHRSVLGEQDERFSNERLEFLGDAVLGAVISGQLFHRYPDADEGFLTRMRSKLVSRQRLNELAESLGILDLLEHEVPADREKLSDIGGDALEALVGAIYIDKGYERVRDWIVRTLMGPIDIETLEHTETDPKSRLIEWAQKEGRELRFEADTSSQSEHRVSLYVDGTERSVGSGRTKKKGEQEAARRFFEEEKRKKEG